jgi:hypothetical protein
MTGVPVPPVISMRIPVNATHRPGGAPPIETDRQTNRPDPGDAPVPFRSALSAQYRTSRHVCKKRSKSSAHRNYYLDSITNIDYDYRNNKE